MYLLFNFFHYISQEFSTVIYGINIKLFLFYFSNFYILLSIFNNIQYLDFFPFFSIIFYIHICFSYLIIFFSYNIFLNFLHPFKFIYEFSTLNFSPFFIFFYILYLYAISYLHQLISFPYLVSKSNFLPIYLWILIDFNIFIIFTRK